MAGEVRATCGAACLRAFRAELAHATVLRPEAQARAAASARRRVATPERRAAWRAQIRTARRQARPLLSELQALEPARLDVLAPGDREVLARYYGLDGQLPRALAEGSSGLLVMGRTDRSCPTAARFGTWIADETRVHQTTNGSTLCGINVATRA